MMNDNDTGDSVLYQVDDQIAVLTLNRPRAHNALNARLRQDFRRALERAEADADVRVIVIRGAGDRAFSAGADITEFLPPESLVVERQQRAQPKWTDMLEASAKPTVAAIHGYCLGGGLEVALACDIRIATDAATFALPEVHLGIVPGAGGTQRLPQIVGLGHALRLILTGERIDAQHALRIGLISRVVPPEALDEAVREETTMLLRGAPRALAYAKEAVRRGWDLPLADGLRLEADLSTFLLSTSDRTEGAKAFRQRRKPDFIGE
jgi:enoyl-CoA hydratase/carnithine racemase